MLASAYNNRGNIYNDKGEHDLAIADFDKAIEINPKSALAYNGRGISNTNMGNYDKAIVNFDEAIRLDPREENPYNNRCLTWYSKGDFDRAIHDCDEAIRINSQFAMAYRNRGVAYDAKGDRDRAIADFDQAIRINPKYSDAYSHRGFAYETKGDYRRAIADYDEVIRLAPKYAWARIARGRSYLKTGDTELAAADFDEAVRLNPEDPSVYNNLAKVYKERGENDRAIAFLSEAIRVKPDSQAGYNARAWALFQVGKAEQARPDADKAVSLNGGNANIRDTRGHILLALGDASGALADFNEALRMEPNSISSLWGRGQVYEMQGRPLLAFSDYKRATEIKSADREHIEAQNKARARLIVLEAQTSQAPVTPALASTQTGTPARPQAPAGRRVALVIGNSAYKATGELPNPKNDAAAVAGELTRLGFEVMERHDLTYERMRRTLGEFEDKTAGAEWAFVYYAGHGMELNGKNWLIPVDAQLIRATDTPDEAIPLDRVLDRLAAVTRLRIVVLDACRNNPYLSRMVMNRVATRAVTRGLTAVEPSHGEVVFYAARDGNLALDGTEGNSPFAAALVKHMDEDGIELGRFFRRVTSSVLAATGNQQEPFVYGRIPDEDFYFKPPK